MKEINHWLAQGIVVNLFWLVPTLLFNIFKIFLLSINTMTRYVTVYVTLLLAVCADIGLLSYSNNWELSLPLLKKPLTIGFVCALVYLFIIVRKNRIDKNKFIEITHNLIEANLVGSSKQLCVKIDSIVERYAAMGYTLMPGQMFSEIADVYSNEVSIRFEIIWNVLLKTIKTNTFTITTKTFKKRLNYELENSFNVLEKYFLGTIDMNAKDKNQTKYLLKEKRLELERDRLGKKYKAETTLLSNGKMFIPDHVR